MGRVVLDYAAFAMSDDPPYSLYFLCIQCHYLSDQAVSAVAHGLARVYLKEFVRV
jgi:hypothetical protein